MRKHLNAYVSAADVAEFVSENRVKTGDTPSSSLIRKQDASPEYTARERHGNLVRKQNWRHRRATAKAFQSSRQHSGAECTGGASNSEYTKRTNKTRSKGDEKTEEPNQCRPCDL